MHRGRGGGQIFQTNSCRAQSSVNCALLRLMVTKCCGRSVFNMATQCCETQCGSCGVWRSPQLLCPRPSPAVREQYPPELFHQRVSAALSRVRSRRKASRLPPSLPLLLGQLRNKCPRGWLSCESCKLGTTRDASSRPACQKTTDPKTTALHTAS